MKTIIISLIAILFSFNSFAQQVDTIYYDKAWRGVKYATMAEHTLYNYRFNDPAYPDITRIYGVNNVLESEGKIKHIDRMSAHNNKWVGTFTEFYPSGEKMTQRTFDSNSILTGEMLGFDKNGDITMRARYVDGMLNGEMREDLGGGAFRITNFRNDVVVDNKATIIEANGTSVDIDLSSGKVMQQAVTTDDCKLEFDNGIGYWSYAKNGIYVSLRYSKIRQFGKYYACTLQVINNTGESFVIDPDQIEGLYKKGSKQRQITMMPAEVYNKKVARNLALMQGLAGAASAMNTMNAGYTTSSSNVSAFGSNGTWAHGTVTTTTFSAAEKQAVMNQEAEKMNAMVSQNNQVKAQIDGDILKHSTINPGEQIIKTFYVEYLSTDKLEISIPLNGTVYTFDMVQQ